MGQLDVMGIGDRVVELRGLESLTRVVLGKNAMKNMEVLRLGGVGQLTSEGVDLGEGALSELSELRCGAGRRGELVCCRCSPGYQGQGAGGKDGESNFVEEVVCLLGWRNRP